MIAIAIVSWQLGSLGVRPYPLDVSAGVPTSLRKTFDFSQTPIEAISIDVMDGTARILPVVQTSDPDDPVLISLLEEWSTFAPTMALVDGELGATFGTTRSLIRNHGISGAILGWAREANSPVYSLNPPPSLVYRTLGKHYSAGALVLFTSLKEYHSLETADTASDALMEEILAVKCRSFGLDNCVFGSIAALDDYWGRAYPRLPNWRDLDASHLVAASEFQNERSADEDAGVALGTVAAAYERLSDEYAIASILAAARSGDRVFIVASPQRFQKIATVLTAESSKQGSFRREPLR